MNFVIKKSIDNTIVKVNLKSYQEENLQAIESNIIRSGINMNYIIDIEKNKMHYFIVL